MKTLVDVLAKPELLTELSLQDQSFVMAEARYFNMLPQLGYLCKAQGIFNSLPQKFQTQLESANFAHQNQANCLRYEQQQLRDILGPLHIDWVYLKGAAYALKGMAGFCGRLFSDIDILVAEKDLCLVETTLKKNGYLAKPITDYDEKFYRHWAHEIPPLQHIFRRVVLDVHFNILPKTIQQALDSQQLFNQAIPLSDHPSEKVLAPAAMLMHSAIHLFFESEFHKGPRDLYDVAVFIQTHGDDPAFWQQLIALHQSVGHQQSLLLALRYAKKIYRCQIPKEVSCYYLAYQPSPVRLKMLDFCFMRIFCQSFPPLQQRGFTLAKTILYLRGHLKRMPIRLLIPHLTKKSLAKLKPKQEAQGLI